MSYDDICCEKDPKFKTLGLEAEFLFKKLLQENGWGMVDATIHEDHKRKVDLWITKELGQKMCQEEVVAVQFTMDVYAASGSKGMEAIRSGIIIVAIPFKELKDWKNAQTAREKNEKAKFIIKKVKEMVKGSINIMQRFRHTLCKPENLLKRFNVNG